MSEEFRNGQIAQEIHIGLKNGKYVLNVLKKPMIPNFTPSPQLNLQGLTEDPTVKA